MIMDRNIEGTWANTQPQDCMEPISQPGRTEAETSKSKQKSKRKWWKFSRKDKNEKTDENLGRTVISMDTPIIDNGPICRGEVPEVGEHNDKSNSITATNIGQPREWLGKFAVNRKPSLDPLDLKNVRKQEKKKKRKETKTSKDILDSSKKSGKSKSASTHSPRPRQPSQQGSVRRDSPPTPSDSDFWGTHVPTDYDPPDTCPVDHVATASDEEYDTEMAYRFPILYKRLSLMNTKPKECRKPQTPVAIEIKPTRKTPEVSNTQELNDSVKRKSPDVVNRKAAYIVDHSMENTFKNNPSYCPKAKGHKDQYKDNVMSDVDILLDELDEIW